MTQYEPPGHESHSCHLDRRFKVQKHHLDEPLAIPPPRRDPTPEESLSRHRQRDKRGRGHGGEDAERRDEDSGDQEDGAVEPEAEVHCARQQIVGRGAGDGCESVTEPVGEEHDGVDAPEEVVEPQEYEGHDDGEVPGAVPGYVGRPLYEGVDGDGEHGVDDRSKYMELVVFICFRDVWKGRVVCVGR